ncbi:MAG: outer rane lipoprotein carrier protein LolA [Chromatiaceae bacterium]|jgi:outer membrane lipoprotein carrier protein|nr:outer rane lipoprotein carrier protein LolA [Chromatiaceae bacterium]
MLSLSHPTGAPRRGLSAVFAVVLAITALTLVGPARGASDGTQRLEDYLKGLTSLKSSFTQVTFNADRTRMMEASGTFYLQRPGRFRWEYDSPNKQVIVADGNRVYLHDLDLEQISHQSQAKALRGTPALLLADGGPIEKHFTAKPIESRDGRDWVELTPKAADTDVVKIELGFGGKELDSMIMEDSFGQMTRLNFSATQRNPSLDPGLFKVDKGAMDDFLSFD